jgi:hypothetical protein
MLIEDRIQALIHKIDVAAGTRWLNYTALTLLVVALAFRYDTHCYRSFSSPEAMDAAQVARNLAGGRGFTTEFIRPFSIYLLQKHNRAAGTNSVDPAQLYGPHPDLANAPVYPVLLAGLFKATSPDWKVDLRGTFWSSGGRFMRYKPEFGIALFNQLLLLAVVWLTFLLARTILDTLAAWLSAILVLYSSELWKFSVSGLPTLLLMVLFLVLVWCLMRFEMLGRADTPEPRRRMMFAVAAGLLTGVGMMTRYSFGWVIVPVVVFIVLFGGPRRSVLGATAGLVFLAVVTPWIVRNVLVSGTPLGTAGYALLENSEFFSGSRLMQSLNPDMYAAFRSIAHVTILKLVSDLTYLFEDQLPRLGGGWVGILFLAGLLLGLRQVMARRLRYFTVMCLGLFVVITALGQTSMSGYSPEVNTENLLVLLSPLAVIFGVAFFLTLLNQMNLPSAPIRYLIIGLVVLLLRLPFTLSLMPPQNSPVAYPPYYPPDVQKISNWMRPDELMMSDVPWAVAWYGDRQCAWTTLNCQYEFNALNDFLKPVNGLYLTLNTLDGKLLSECMQGPVDNWSHFAYRTLAYNQLPNNFPLTQFPQGSLLSGFFITDHARWKTQ